jgi:fructose-1,6-bisphosphatase/inositol monophosphatase family enzyme
MMSNKPWDTAAGVLLAREARALVTVHAVADELAVVIKSTTLSGQRA